MTTINIDLSGELENELSTEASQLKTASSGIHFARTVLSPFSPESSKDRTGACYLLGKHWGSEL